MSPGLRLRSAAASAAAAAALIALLPRPLEGGAGEPWPVNAIVGARVVVAPGVVHGRATIVIRDGVIEAVGPEVKPPADARIWEGAGRTVYPGLIDPYLSASRLAGEAKPDAAPEVSWWDRNDPRETPRLAGASHELPWVHPEQEVARDLKLDDAAVAKYRALGFVAAGVVPERGIFRGYSAVVGLGQGPVNSLVLRPRAAQVVAFETQDGEYPDSLMGVIAAIRQTLTDARWYRDAHQAWALRPAGRERPETSVPLEALGAVLQGKVPVVLDAMSDPLNVLRAARLAAEHGLALQVVATGAEYRRLDEVRASGLRLIVPLDFPAPPEVGDEEEWTTVATERLRHWKRAPSNPRWLAEAGVRFALTSAKLDPQSATQDFAEGLRAAIEAGLTRQQALAALTTVPAELLGVSGLLGTIEKGKAASFVVADGDPFEERTVVLDVWIDGRRHPVARPKAPTAEITDPWWLTIEPPAGPTRRLVLEIERVQGDLRARVVEPDAPGGPRTRPARCVVLQDSTLTAELDLEGGGLLVAEVVADDFAGFLVSADGSLAAVRGARLRVEPAKRRGPFPPAAAPRPDGEVVAAPAAVLVRGATVWTSGPQNTLAGADLLVAGGKVQAVGRGLAVPAGAMVVDGTGRHVTPGLIDAHSHTAISDGVNEGTRAVTAEVRIGDVVDSEDQNLYRQLAGGLTVALQLHGSANPIGGQSQTIKLRWGAPPEELKLEGAMPGIKFALGENVKQSNWGDRHVKRYPQTRMGVEQVMRERFLAARDYLREWEEFRRLRPADAALIPPRRDLQLETLAEILRGERLVHCHSYRQDEILMLIRLMDEMGVRIATFQHGLETYKVADEVRAHGAGASIFTDWWAYKFEVYDAIPYAAALLRERGVVVSFNSDSADLARRLNVEAAKAVKYGGIAEEEALRFVTLYPAMQLRIDRRVGSLEPGKDGDFVIWNDHPLSTYARAEQTWIEGQMRFDRTADLERRRGLEHERTRLVAEVKEVLKGAPHRPRPGRGYQGTAATQQGDHSCFDGALAEAGE